MVGWIARHHVAASALAVSVALAIASVALHPSLASAQAVANVVLVAAGSLILVRRPGNGTGPLLMALGLGFLVLLTVATFAEARVKGDPDTVAWLFLFDEALFPLLAWIMVPMLLLFPGGSISSRWERRFVLGSLAFAVVTAVQGFLGTPTSVLDDEIVVPHPFLDPATAAELDGLTDPLVGIIILFILVAALSNVRKWRRGNAVERRQIGWLAIGGVLYILIAAVNTIVGQDLYSGEMFLFIDAMGVMLIPVAIGVAIMRYGLYEIDAIVNRSLIFGVLAAFIGGVYVGIVFGVSSLVGGTSVELSIAATVIVALAFQPVRGRVVRWANRLVYGERATPYEVLQQFSRRSAAETGDELLPRIPELLATGCGASRAAVWIRDNDGFQTAAVWPADVSVRTIAVADRPDGLEGFDDPDADISQPIHHDGELLGGISLRKPASEPVTPDDVELVASLASGLGLALRNRRLTAALRARVVELEASRERVLVAADEARRALENDLERGAQQTLVAVKVMLGPLSLLAERGGAPKTAAMLSQLEDHAGTAISSVRAFAAGVYPPLLQAEGLGVALDHRTATSAVPVEVTADGVGRYPREVESAVYFSILEALQNTAKYAGAARACVSLSERDGELRFDVTDDGTGFEVDRVQRGVGLDGMADRIDTVGGSVAIRSEPGAGTTVSGRVPVVAGGAVAI